MLRTENLPLFDGWLDGEGIGVDAQWLDKIKPVLHAVEVDAPVYPLFSGGIQIEKDCDDQVVEITIKNGSFEAEISILDVEKDEEERLTISLSDPMASKRITGLLNCSKMVERLKNHSVQMSVQKKLPQRRQGKQ